MYGNDAIPKAPQLAKREAAVNPPGARQVTAGYLRRISDNALRLGKMGLRPAFSGERGRSRYCSGISDWLLSFNGAFAQASISAHRPPKNSSGGIGFLRAVGWA